jgi:hypothetical protein
MKKTIAMLLALVMAVCIFPLSAFADYNEYIDTTDEPDPVSAAIYVFYDRNGNWYEVDSSVKISTYQNSTYTGYVCVIQEVLTRLYNKDQSLYNNFNPKGIDGTYGNNTKQAVICFQVSRIGENDGDGIVGPTTWYYLYKDWANTLNSAWLSSVTA